MITFTASSATFFPTPTEFTVDVGAQITKEVTMLEKTGGDFPLEQARADGFNAVKEKVSFDIKNLPIATVIALDGYFNELNGVVPIDLVFPGTGTVTAAVAGTNGLIISARYRILTTGSPSINWTAIGATSGAVGTSFYYNGVTTTGGPASVRTVVKRVLITSWSADIPNSKFGAISASGKLVRI
jgi:hypothetical protein